MVDDKTIGREPRETDERSALRGLTRKFTVTHVVLNLPGERRTAKSPAGCSALQPHWVCSAHRPPKTPSGSDVATLETTAGLDGDIHVVNGTKLYITSGVRADFVTTTVRTVVTVATGEFCRSVAVRWVAGKGILDTSGWPRPEVS